MTPVGFALLAFAGFITFAHFGSLALRDGEALQIAGTCFGACLLIAAALLLPGA